MTKYSEMGLYFRRRMEEGKFQPTPLPPLELNRGVDVNECTPPTTEKCFKFPRSTLSVVEEESPPTVREEDTPSSPLIPKPSDHAPLIPTIFPNGATCVATMHNGTLGACVRHTESDSSECILRKTETDQIPEKTFSDGVRLRISMPKPPSTCLNVCFEPGKDNTVNRLNISIGLRNWLYSCVIIGLLYFGWKFK